jgi:hypothetical protein
MAGAPRLPGTRTLSVTANPQRVKTSRDRDSEFELSINDGLPELKTRQKPTGACPPAGKSFTGYSSGSLMTAGSSSSDSSSPFSSSLSSSSSLGSRGGIMLTASTDQRKRSRGCAVISAPVGRQPGRHEQLRWPCQRKAAITAA